jgi:hypothetical protein
MCFNFAGTARQAFHMGARQGKCFIFACMTVKTVCVLISPLVVQYSREQCLQKFIYTIQISNNMEEIPYFFQQLFYSVQFQQKP